jgi:gas vesicle protein
MKTNIIIPIIAGAAITAGLAYLFTTEEGEELRGKLADNIKEHFPQAGEQLTAIKDKFMENLGKQS